MLRVMQRRLMGEELLEEKGIVPQGRLNRSASVRGGEQVLLGPDEDAEIAGHKAAAPPNDKALPSVFSPPNKNSK
jgi:hypothetical protein